MNPVIPSPDVLPIPGPVWLFELLLHLTFLIHLVLMNFLVGGAVIALVERWRVWRSGEQSDLGPSRDLARWIETRLPTAFALTVTFGVAPLLFVQTLYGHLFYTSSVVMAWPWLLVILILLVSYYFSYSLSWRGDSFRGWNMVKSWKVLGGLLLLAFLLSNNMGLALRPEAWAEKYFARPSGMHLNLDDPTFWPRLFHFLFGAMAVAGMGLAVVSARRLDRGDERGKHWLEVGALWFLVPTALQIMDGLWFLITLPREAMMPMLGGDTTATMIFMIAVTLPLLALITMVLGLRAKRRFPIVHASAWLLGLTLVGMILNRDQVRKNMLAEHFELSSLDAQPQWGAFAVFAILFVIALATVGWMAVVFLRAKPQDEIPTS